MKKLLLLILTFFSFINISFADLDFTGAETLTGFNSVNYIYGSDFNSDGTKFVYYSLEIGNFLNEVNLSTPYDLDTAGSVFQYAIPTDMKSFSIIDDLYLIGFNNLKQIVKYTLNSGSINGMVYNSTTSTTYAWSQAGDWVNGGEYFISAYTSSSKIYKNTIPYDYSTAVLYSTDTTGKVCHNGSDLSFDGFYWFCRNDYTVYKLSIAFDLGSTLLSVGTLSQDGGTVTSLHISQDMSNYAHSTTTLGTDSWNTSQIIPTGPPPLTDVHIVDIDSLENGVRVNFVCEQDCELIAGIYSEDETVFYNSNTDIFSGSLDTQSIIIDVSLSYQQDYKIIAGFYDLYDPEIEILDTRIFTYWYDADPNDYQIGDFIFTPFNFNRLTNGFELENLDVNNIGGYFILKITGPNGFVVGEYVSYDVVKRHESVEPGGYGSGSLMQITYPYHKWAGDYELLITYEYPGLGTILYPYGTGALNYAITEPEWSWEDSTLYLCDTNEDGIVSDLELSSCQNELEGGYLERLDNFYINIKSLFIELMKIGKVDSKEWGFYFIPQVNAELVSDRINMTMNTDNDNILTDVYFFLKGFILFTFLIMGVMLIIIINKKE